MDAADEEPAHGTLGEELDKLAALFEYGALEAASFPAQFVARVRGEIVRLRALVGEGVRVAEDQTLSEGELARVRESLRLSWTRKKPGQG